MTKPWGDFFGHAARECDDCGRSFYPKQGWERICYPCWRKSKDEQGSASHGPQVTIMADPRLPTVDEWAGMMMRLIKLTHPDKHNNSPESNRVTQWLLDQRERLPPG